MNYEDRYPILKRGIHWFFESWTTRNNTIPVPDKVMKNLDWNEKTLLELAYTEDGHERGPGWIIRQSKVLAEKYIHPEKDEG